MSSSVNFVFPVTENRQELNIAASNLRENIIKLADLTEKIDATIKRDHVPCDIIDLSWLFQEKCKMFDNIKENLMVSDNRDLLMTNEEMCINLYDTLVKEKIEQKQILEHITKELQELEDTFSKMKEFLHQSEFNIKATETSKINTPEMLDVNLLYTNSAEKMRLMRNKFHKFLNLCFKNSNSKELIHDLTIAYFKGGDSKYIDVCDTEKYLIEDIKLLKISNLVVEDPYDNLRVKFDDIDY